MKRLLILITGLLFTSAMVYAGNGDLIVNGNVGIGTTNPQKGLDIENSVGGLPPTLGSAIVGGLRISNTGNIAIDFGMLATAPPYPGWIQVHDANNWANNSPLLLNPNGGNVGIGTTNPSQKLDVAGNLASNGVILTSDIKFKKGIFPIDDSLTKLLSLNGVSYQWKTDEYKDKGFPEGRHYGVIAQEIEKVLPEVVNTAPDGTKSVAYTEIIPVLIEAMKAQQKAIDGQQKKIEELEKKVSQLP